MFFQASCINCAPGEDLTIAWAFDSRDMSNTVTSFDVSTNSLGSSTDIRITLQLDVFASPNIGNEEYWFTATG